MLLLSFNHEQTPKFTARGLKKEKINVMQMPSMELNTARKSLA